MDYNDYIREVCKETAPPMPEEDFDAMKFSILNPSEFTDVLLDDIVARYEAPTS